MFDPAAYCRIASDTIEHLRRCDVYRLISTCWPANRLQLVEWIKTHRPDLTDEVDSCLAEVE